MLSKKQTLSTKVVTHPFVQNWIMHVMEDHLTHPDRTTFRRQFTQKLEAYLRDVIRIATELDPIHTTTFFPAYHRKKVDEIGKTYPRATRKRHVMGRTLSLMARDTLLLTQMIMEESFIGQKKENTYLPHEVTPGFTTWHKNLTH